MIKEVFYGEDAPEKRVDRSMDPWKAAQPQRLTGAMNLAVNDHESVGQSNRLRVGLKGRATAGLIAAGAMGWLFVAGSLQPDPSGTGTHEQLGLPACGFLARTGYPCPTCGMTTAFALIARGRLVSAVLAQPAGALMAVAVFAAAVGGLYVSLTGRRLDLFWLAWNWRAVLIGALAVVLLAWGYRCLLTRLIVNA